MAKEADQRAIKAMLGKLVREEGNKSCSECGAKNPRWASTNLGIFFCLRCSGIHRSMGTHISKVKSVSLDNWTWDQANQMKKMGNIKANKMWEATMPSTRKPTESSSISVITRFIIDKYDNKNWYDPSALDSKKKKKTKHHDSSSDSDWLESASDSDVSPKKPKKKKKKPKKKAKESSSDDFSDFNFTDTTEEDFNPRNKKKKSPGRKKKEPKKEPTRKKKHAPKKEPAPKKIDQGPDLLSGGQMNDMTMNNEPNDLLNNDKLFDNILNTEEPKDILNPGSMIEQKQIVNPGGNRMVTSGQGRGTKNIMNIFDQKNPKQDPFQGMGMMGRGGQMMRPMQPMMRPMMRPMMQPMMQQQRMMSPMMQQPMMQQRMGMMNMRPMMRPMMSPVIRQPMMQVDPLGLGGRTNVQSINSNKPAYNHKAKPKSTAFDTLNVFDNM